MWDKQCSGGPKLSCHIISDIAIKKNNKILKKKKKAKPPFILEAHRDFKKKSKNIQGYVV